MSTSADDHAEMGVEIVSRSSMYDSESESQLDDDCVSENSFGSYLGDNAMDEENMTADIELDSSLPDVADEEYPQSMSIPDDMYVRSPSLVPQYTPPTRSTQLEPAFDAKFSGPSMCVVRGLISTQH
jgi:hypothetical protein